MSLIRGLGWSYLERWGNKIISLIVFIVLARILNSRDFGLVAFAKLFIDYLDWISGQGLDFAIIQRKELTEEHLDTAFWINVLIASSLSLFIYAVAPTVEILFKEAGVALVLRSLTPLILLNSLSRVQVAIMMRHHDFRKLAIRGLVMSVFGGGVGITFAINGCGVWSLVAQQITSMVVAFLLLWGAASWRPRLNFSKTSAKELYDFALKIFLDQQVNFASRRIDELLIATFLGMSLLGYYSVAKKLFETAIDLIYSVLSRVLVAVFSRDQENFSVIIDKTFKMNMFISALTFPVFIFAAVAHLEVITLFFGEKWKLAAIPFALLMTSGLFLLVPNLFHPIFSAMGKPSVPLKLNIFRAIASVFLITGSVSYGLIGISLAVLVRNIFGACLDFYLLKLELRMNILPLIKEQLAQTMYCIPMALVLLGMSYTLISGWSSLERMMCYVGVGAMVYLTTLKVFNPQIIDAGLELFMHYRKGKA